MSRHVHADLIKEWAEDTSRVVQWIYEGEVWVDCCGDPCWEPNVKYRFKPEPKPDVVRYLMIKPHAGGVLPHHDDNIKITWDGETGKLKSAEVIDD